jgi:hypothetical protein
MTMRLKRIGVSLLLLFGCASGFAQSGDGRSGGNLTSAFYLFRAAMENGGQEGGRQTQRTSEQRPNPQAGESSGFGGNPYGNGNPQAEQAPKQNKLSPEERRALRRQIDEAGHDIYTRKR